MKKKSQSQLFEELTPSTDTGNSTPKSKPKFSGTDNPRHLRVIHSLLIRPRKREEIDRIAGASNGPELIAELRRRCLHIPCDKAPGIDRDGFPVKFGVYALSDDDRRKISIWQRKNQGRK